MIIVTFNTAHLTMQCVDSVYNSTSDITFEVIVVDNSSMDDTEAIFSKDQRVHYIRNNRNLGFGQANNIGMNAAKGEFLLLLNSDTILTGNALKTMYDHAVRFGPKLGAMGTVLQSLDKRDIHSFGSFPTLTDSLFGPYRRNMAGKSFNTPSRDIMNVDYVTGADMLVPRSVFVSMDGFDQRFFMYFEEADWQKRMAGRGLARIIIPCRDIVHLEGGSEDGKKTGWSFNRYRNATVSRIKYLSKHSSRLTYILFRILFPVFRLPVILMSSFTISEKMRLTKDLIS